jgi:methylenetetrahydrofolate--tRNA-(uracil-5-)-methyltransferase
MGGRSAPRVSVVGAGLAGCEAAWQIARRGVEVALLEMKPLRFSPAHRSRDFAELVCSNSLRAASTQSAVGLLKEEMRRLGSLVMAAADECAVPAGRALAVDRVAFARRITDAVESHPRIRVEQRVVERVPDDALVIVASGPLTGAELARDLADLLEEMARRGPETLAHGPMKPVGLVDPRTGRRPSAVVQLRQEDKQGILYNVVDFQTKLRRACAS